MKDEVYAEYRSAVSARLDQRKTTAAISQSPLQPHPHLRCNYPKQIGDTRSLVRGCPFSYKSAR
jgi:hypothetical protein